MIYFLVYYCRLQIIKGNLLMIKMMMKEHSLNDLCASKAWQSTNLLVSTTLQCNSFRVQDNSVKPYLDFKFYIN